MILTRHKVLIADRYIIQLNTVKVKAYLSTFAAGIALDDVVVVVALGIYFEVNVSVFQVDVVNAIFPFPDFEHIKGDVDGAKFPEQGFALRSALVNFYVMEFEIDFGKLVDDGEVDLRIDDDFGIEVFIDLIESHFNDFVFVEV